MAKTTTSTPQENASSRRTLARPRANTGARPVADVAAGRASAPNLVSFFQESRAELRKVTWPTRQEAMNLTIAVVGMTVGLAIFLGLIDAGLDQAVTWLLG